MRTKWQSGSGVGDAPIGVLMGNHPHGNGGQPRGKTNPYLSRKINPARCRYISENIEINANKYVVFYLR